MNARWFKAIGITLYVAISGNAGAQELAVRAQFPWKPGQVPGQSFIVRSQEACANVQARGGSWESRSIVSLRRTPRDAVCSYTWTSVNTAPDLAALSKLRGAIVERDPPVVVPNADPERDLKWFGPLNELARLRLAIPDERPAHDKTTRVRVAILDTAADTAHGVVDPSRHGLAVSRLVDELACGKLDPCATEIRHISAMPFISDPAQGVLSLVDQGAIGTRGTLAAAIETASSEWANTPAATRPAHLIVNMSAGWSGCWEVDAKAQTATNDALFTAQRDLGSEAVYRALVRSACRGALNVAASGNGQPDLGCPKDPPSPGAPRFMFPGLWGGAKVDPAMCRSAGIEANFSEPRPLVIGVSAVDQNDNLLSLAANLSSEVAFGQLVTNRDPADPSGWTLSLSGTSMSAAAFSGVAAAVLSYDPSLSLAKLYELIRDTSVGLGIDPAAISGDFVCNATFASSGCDDVRRLSLCNALSKVVPGLSCSTPEAARETPASFQTMSPIALASAGTAVDCADCGAGPCPAACDIPVSQLDSQTGPWVVPQPQPPGCTTCAMVPLLPIFQAEFYYPVGSLVLVVKRLIGPDVRIALQDGQVPAFQPTTWLLPLSALGGISARLVYRASSSLAKESGDVLVTNIPPFTVPCGILGPC